LADSALPEEEVIEENTLLEIRSGKLIYRWNNDLAEGLNNILEFLFYLGFFPELPGVKILDINQIVK
ncbi:MAG: hypothetical protein QG635_2089, partial [Bacteroidota bacterium]|nr:hypothetical protein [Bacteroidota bacterium]